MKKKLLLLSILFFSVISLSHAALVVDMGNSTKTGAYYTFPNLTVTGNAGDKGYVIRFMFTRTVETGDAISLPTMPSSNWTENAVSTEYVRMIDITGGAIAAELQDFLRSIQITFASTKKGQEVAVLISETSTDTGKNIYYSSDTDHWYEYVSATQILWTNAYNAALDRTFMGLTGYLANITSKEEDDFIFTIASGKYGWFSGTRYDVRTVMQANGKLSGVPTAAFDYWYWSCGPEWDDTKNAAYPNGNPADAVFYNKRTYTSAAAAVTVKYNYTNWHSINPSNSGGGEYCIQAIPDEGGTWNDWPNYYASITGYIVEYRGTLIAANAMGIVGFGSVKNASINGVTDNGTSVSPVSLNFGDVLTYTITAANLSETNTAVIVRDMLPAGLNIVGGSISNGGTYNSTTREIVWNLTIPTENEMNVSFQATKILGVDNVMLNTAYVISDGAVIKQTNYTYHQGILSQTEYPDNIIDADCYIDPTAQAWGIRETKTHNQADVHNLASVYTGDLNGDGYPELITYTSDNNLGIDDGRYAQRMLIYMGPDHSTIKTITAAATSYFPLWVGATALVKTQILGKDTALIISQCYDGKLHAFNVDGAKVWTSQVLTSRLSSSRFFIVGAADFDNDGIPEIYCGHDIFDSRTGTLICTKSTGNFGLSNSGGLANPSGTTGTGTVYERGIVAPIAADVDGDGILEYIAGSEVYKVDLVSGTMTLATSVTPPYDIYNSTVLMPQDGKTQVADIDLDGYLDIIVSGTYTIENVNNYAYVWVWSPVKNKVLARTNVAYARNQSYPFIGDIDGDGYPEILFITSLQRTNATWAGYDYMWAFKYDGTDTLFEFWKLAHSDRSGNTGITLFDFNQDGISEIVFRDESHLRIINGSLIHHQSGAPVAEPYNLAAYTCYSATGAEYPIVADIDNDGMAEIIATGHPSNSTFPFASAPLRIFRADVGTSWAPARKVWNQYAYNAVNINEDLTIPIYQLNPATVFPGNDGQLGTSDDVRPYNAFLQQQTALNKNGTPLWLVPNAQLDTPDPAFTYHADGDSLYIELKIKNIGNAALQAPVKITVHKDVVPAPAAARYTYQYPQSILQGASAEVKFAIPNYSSWIGAVDNDTKLILKINDNGKGYNDQPVCDSVNIKYEQALNALVFAKNDSIEYIQGIRPFDLIDVLTNDVIPAACTGLNPVVVNVAKGSASVDASGKIVYDTPDTDFVGYDTITYSITCNANISYAKVYIMVHERPDNLVDQENCYIDVPSFDFKIKQKWESALNTVHTFGTPLIGDLNGDGVAEIVVVNADYTGLNVFDGRTQQIKTSIATPNFYNGMASPSPAVLVDADGNGLGEIIVVRADNKLISYEADTTGGTFKFKEKWLPAGGVLLNIEGSGARQLPVPIIADLNGDGIPEVIVANQIHNAVTGDYLGQTELAASAHYGRAPDQALGNLNFQTVADIDGDGLPEIIAGGRVYKVNFNPAKTAVSCQKLYSVNINDGFTAVADVDMDGMLDVVTVTGGATINTVMLTVWNPATETIIGQITQTADAKRFSFPFVGDIDGYIASDGKKHPEICIIVRVGAAVGRIYAFKYVPEAVDKIQLKWSVNNTDESGATGITLFDFNNDGISELVYRDETHLQILDGRLDGVAPALALPAGIDSDYPEGSKIFCRSATAFDYPTIADIDGDGSADICVTCHFGPSRYVPNNTERLVVFESGSKPWITTRQVWNQLSYEPLYINEDLTVPRYPIPKHTEFNGKHPYNGTLIQIPTMVNTDFEVIMLSPDPAVENMRLEQLNGSTVRVWVHIKNKGVKNTNAGLPVALYGINPPPTPADGSHIAIKAVGVNIVPGDSYDMYFDVPKGDMSPVLSVRIQDDGVKYPADGSYLDCDYTNNTGYVSGFIALDDKYVITGQKDLDVLANDCFGSCVRGSLAAFDTISASEFLTNGTLIINVPGDSTFTYAPVTTGIDSVGYYTKCGADSSAAMVHILTLKPYSQQYVACPGAEVTMGFEAINNVVFNWYDNDPDMGGNLIATANSLKVIKDKITAGTDRDYSIWWVQAVYKGIKFPVYEVNLLASDNCGTIAPTGCAEDGTLLFKEDFGGNEKTDPVDGPALPSSIISYTYLPGQMSAGGAYCIAKTSKPHPGGTWYVTGDHTSESDNAEGYLLQVNAGSETGQFYEYKIDNLCPGMQLYFSTWIFNVQNPPAPDKPNMIFVLEDPVTNNVIAQYYTGNILDNNPNWRHYGFSFTMPEGQSSLLFRIINNGTGTMGNDFAIDDIEIRLCAPPVRITNPVEDEARVCPESSFTFRGEYTDNPVTFTKNGGELTYFWIYSATGDVKTPSSWVKIDGTEGTEGSDHVESEYTIPFVTEAHEGYYRLVVADAANINNYNCRSMSRVIHFKVHEVTKFHPDIRIQACSDIGVINLSKYLDTAGFEWVKWYESTPLSPAVDEATGNVNSAGLVYPNTYGYRYQLKNTCFTPEGRLYIKTISGSPVGLPPATVVVCWEDAVSLSLDRIMGIEAGGVFEPVESSIGDVSRYVEVATAPHIYAGATVFNGREAYLNLSAGDYGITYQGDTDARKVVFKYKITDTNSCLYGNEYTIEIILTSKLIP